MTHFNEWTTTEWTRSTATRVARVEIDATTDERPLKFWLWLKDRSNLNGTLLLPNGRSHPTFYPLEMDSVEAAKALADAFLRQDFGLVD